MRFVLRSMLRRPAVPLAVVTTMALAVAANTALFSVVDGLLFRPLPYRDSTRIVHLQLEASEHRPRSRADLQELVERAARTDSLIERADARPTPLFDPTSTAATDWLLRPAVLSESFFELFGVVPIRGRSFDKADFEGPPFAVLLGYNIWRGRFGADESIVGRVISIPGTAPGTQWRVLGVMPPGFSFPRGANFWIPAYPFYPHPSVLPYARLAPGHTASSVRAQLPGLRVTHLRDWVRPEGAFAYLMLLFATALLLAVALAQIAGLLLTRASGLTRDVGVRFALGASTRAVVWQFAQEAALIVLVAVAIALCAAEPLTRVILRMLPDGLTAGQNLLPDRRAFLWSSIGAGVSILLLTLIPVRIVRRTSAMVLLRGELSDGARFHSERLQRALCVLQLATVTALLYLTALTYRSFAAVGDVDLGYEPEGLFAFNMPRGDDLVEGPASVRLRYQRQLVAETLQALAHIQGVRAVAGAHFWPFQPNALTDDVFPSNADASAYPTPGKYAAVTSGFSAVLGLDVVAGREPWLEELIAIGDRQPPGEQFAVVNETMARSLATYGSPVGQVLAGRFRVTGVLSDTRLEAPDRQAPPTLFHYVPPPAAPGVVLVRLAPGRSPDELGIPVVISRIWRNRHVPVISLNGAFQAAMSDYRARVAVLSAISTLMLPLCVVGVLGMVALHLRHRTQEIAVRLALGANPGAIERHVLGRLLALCALGVSAGLGVGMALGALLRGSLFGISPVDGGSVVMSVVTSVATVSAAAIIPAQRAARVNPADALRHT